jgi:hypothetical protein
MSAVWLAAELVQQLVLARDEAPEPEDVKAGWKALVVFLLLIGAVVLLAFSLVKQLRKADEARKAGVFGDEDRPPEPDEDEDADQPSS